MASYQILYWQDIPSQIKVWDEFDEVTVPLSARFVARIDQAAQQRGLTGADEYLAQWRWGEQQEREGTAAEVARALEREIEAGY